MFSEEGKPGRSADTAPSQDDSNIAIRVTALSKCYHIYDKPHDRLKQMLLRGRKQFYREFWALRNLSFEVRKGETVGVVGRNGSGKSTLLQLICGTLNPTAGSIIANGRIAALLELGSGFNPEFSGRENVYMNGALLGLDRTEIDSRLDSIFAFADIGDFIDQPVKSYSSGMQLRLAFAVQASVEPDILIVDEALAVGDERFQRKCFARLEELKGKGTSILFVSHSAPQVVELCDRALFLEHGERLLFGDPHRVTRAYQKLIYAPEEDQRRLVEEYRQDDEAEHAEAPGVSDAAPLRTEHHQNSESLDQTLAGERDYFDPNLISASTLSYPVQGAEIKTVRIQNAAGLDVNVINSGSEYKFTVTGKALSDIANIHFGMHFRNISGLQITGQRFPEAGKMIDAVCSGADFSISFNFRISLLPGTYFLGTGIWSNNGETCIHRILDALMFRVDSPRKAISFGYVDMIGDDPEFCVNGALFDAGNPDLSTA